MAAQPDPATRRGRRQDAEANRDRILRTARILFASDPNSSMDDLAMAAGVVRRTVYGHFPNRDALIAGLADQASNDILDALGRVDRSTLEPEVALAEFVLTLWEVGAHYRLLISLGRGSLGESGLRELLAPVGEQGRILLARGRQTGRFATHLPPAALDLGLRAMTLALLEAINDGTLVDDEAQAATATLLAAGVPIDGAGPAVAAAQRIRHSSHNSGSQPPEETS